MRMPLDPDLVLELYDKFRSYKVVAENIAAQGIKNDRTGEPYTKYGIKYLVKNAPKWAEFSRKLKAEDARTRAKMVAIRDRNQKR